MDFYLQDVWTLTDRLTINAGVRVGSQRMGYLGSSNVPGGTCPAVVGCIREIADIDANVAGALPFVVRPGRRDPCRKQPHQLVEHRPAGRIHFRHHRRGPLGLQGLLGPLLPQHEFRHTERQPRRHKSVRYEFLDQNANGLFDGAGELGSRVSGSSGAGLARDGIDHSLPPTGNPIDPNLWQPYVDEVSASVEHQVGSDLGLRASLVHKRQTGAWGNLNIARIGTLTNVKQVACPDTCPDGFAGTSLTVNDLPDGAPTSENLNTNVPDGEGDFNWTTVSLGVNRRFRNNFFWNAYFDYQWRHEGPDTGPEFEPSHDGSRRCRLDIPVRFSSRSSRMSRTGSSRARPAM